LKLLLSFLPYSGHERRPSFLTCANRLTQTVPFNFHLGVLLLVEHVRDWVLTASLLSLHPFCIVPPSLAGGIIMSQQASVLLLINHLIRILLHSDVNAGRGEDIDQMLAAGDATTADYLVGHDDDLIDVPPCMITGES
jgi:hypothetical protein